MEMRYRTIQMEATSPKENLTDLLNLTSVVAFKARIPRQIVLRNLRKIIDEQYFREIMKLGDTELWEASEKEKEI